MGCIAFGLVGVSSSAYGSSITAPVTRMVPLNLPARFGGASVRVQLGNFTADGDLWLEVRRPGSAVTTLVEVDPRTGHEVEQVSAGMFVYTSMVMGPDGNAWFGGYQRMDGQFDPMIGSVSAAGRVRRFALPMRFKETLPGIVSVAAGPGGEVWFTGDENFEAAVGHVTMAGKVSITQFPQVDVWYCGLVATPLGRLYSTRFTGNNGTQPVRLPLTGTRMTRLVAPLTLESSDQAGDVLGWGRERPARTTPAGHTRYFNWQPGSGVTGDVYGGAITQGSDGSDWFTASGSDDAVGSQGTNVPTNPVLGRIEPNGGVTTWPTTVVGTDQFPLGDQFPDDRTNAAPINQDALQPGPDGRLYAVGSQVSPNTSNVEQIGPFLPWHLYETTLPDQPVMRAPKVRLLSARSSGDHVTVRLYCIAQPGRYCAGAITVVTDSATVTQSYADTPKMTQTYSLRIKHSLGHGARVAISARDPETGTTKTVAGRVT